MRKKTITYAVFFLFLLFLVPVRDSHSQLSDQQLVVGRAISLTTPYEIGDVAVSDASICNFVVRENRKELYINPLKQGLASITIWDTSDKKQDSFTVTVVAVNIDALMKAAQGFVRTIPGVQAVSSGEEVMLTGEVASPMQLKAVDDFVKEHPAVKSEVKLSQKALEVIANKIGEAVGVPGITVRSVRDKLVMEGLTYSKDQYKKIDTIAKLYAPQIINLVEMRETNRRPGYEKTISVDVYFMEIKNSSVQSLGIQWAPGATNKESDQQSGGGAGGGSIMGVDFKSLVGFVTSLFPKLKWIHETGRGRILEKPSFIVKSGEAVDFYSGTQVPYFSNNEVTFKEVGIKVNAEPIATNNNIDMKITVDVSSLSSTVDKGIDTDKVSTTVYLKQNESVVLGGLIRNNDVKTYNKVPPKMDPDSPLFGLFLSKDFQSSKSQFYVFIQPIIIEEPGSAEVQLKRWLEINKEIDLSRKLK